MQDVQFQRRALALLELALEAAPADREGVLAEGAGDDARLRAEVEALLACETKGELSKIDGLPSVVELAPGGDEEGPAPGARVADFELVRLLGSGGMGRVYEARQERPERKVALKMLRHELDSESSRRRFHWEAEVLARLRHPGIAQVYEVGVHHEQTDLGKREVPWFAMEFVEGARPITHWAREERPTTGELVALFADVCDAVHHGHQRGVLHRDLKAPNVLVDAERRPKVIDFGVARALDADGARTRATLAGELVGTLQAMAPEQIEGDPEDLDTRCDVFALGALLYEMLAGRPPLELNGRSLAEAARIIATVAPKSLRAVVPGLPHDLDTIVLKSMEKDRERRYVSAAALADDLRRFLRQEPVEAHPPSRTYQLRLFARRHRTVVGAVALIVVVSLVATIISLGFASDARAALADADVLETSLIEYGEAITFDLVDELRRQGVGTKVRAELVRDATERMEALEARAGDDHEVLSSLAASHLRLGDVLGNPYVPNLGDQEGAWRSLTRARELAERVLEERPNDFEMRRIRARCGLGLSELRFARGEVFEVADHMRRAVEELEELAAERPDDLEVQLDLGDGLYALGSGMHSRFDEALALLDRSETIYENILAQRPGDRRVRGRLASVTVTRGAMLTVLGQGERGLADLEKAVVLNETLLEEDPHDDLARAELVTAYYELSGALHRDGSPARGLEALERMEENLLPLRERDPDNALLFKHEAFLRVARSVFLLDLARQQREEGSEWRAHAHSAQASLESAVRLLEEADEVERPVWFATTEEYMRQARAGVAELLGEGAG